HRGQELRPARARLLAPGGRGRAGQRQRQPRSRVAQAPREGPRRGLVRDHERRAVRAPAARVHGDAGAGERGRRGGVIGWWILWGALFAWLIVWQTRRALREPLEHDRIIAEADDKPA